MGLALMGMKGSGGGILTVSLDDRVHFLVNFEFNFCMGIGLVCVGLEDMVCELFELYGAHWSFLFLHF